MVFLTQDRGEPLEAIDRGVALSLRLGRELEPNFRTRMLFEIGMEPALAHELAEGGHLLGLSD
jgi:hypothetical protein